MTEVVVNARIAGTRITNEDHGILTFWITLEWRGGDQCFGGYALVVGSPENRKGFGPGLVAIEKILETVGVSSWEALKGQLVRAKIGQLGTSRPPIIGHIMEDKWFDLKSFMEQGSNRYD